MNLNDLLFIMQIGNAVINYETDQRGMYDYLWTHAIISDQDVYQIHKYCNFSSSASPEPRECNATIDAVQNYFNYFNVYNIYAPLCFSPNLTAQPKKTSVC